MPWAGASRANGERGDAADRILRSPVFSPDGFRLEVVAIYQALYRKWRPRVFDDVVGQAHITDTLKRQVASGRLSHAYLFTGTRGTGKTTCAKLLARAVNCEHQTDGNPCNQCPACLGIENGSILDVLELDAASNNGVDQVRALRDEAVYTPAAVRKRVYIVDEVHMLSTAAFNALLKILEEPPSHLMFILATTELHKVPATIKSRCQQFAFKRIQPADIARRLAYVAEQEGISLHSSGAALLSRLADGGMRDALSLLDQCITPNGVVGEHEVLDALGLAGNLEIAALMEQIGVHDTAGALASLARLYGAGKEVGNLLNELSALARDLLIHQTAPKGGEALLTGGYDTAVMERLSALLPAPRLVQILELLQNTGTELARSSNRRTSAELCLIRLCDETLDTGLAGIYARLARLETLADAGGISAPPASAPKKAPSAPKAQPVPPAGPEPEERPWEDVPPWEERPPLPEEPGERIEPVPEPDFQPPAKPKPAEPPASDFWQGLVAALRGRVPQGEYTFLKDPANVQGRLEGGKLTLWVESEFLKQLIGKPAVLEAVAQEAAAQAGHPVQCTVAVGHPNEAPAPSPAGPSERRPLDRLLDRGAKLDGIFRVEP